MNNDIVTKVGVINVRLVQKNKKYEILTENQVLIEFYDSTEEDNIVSKYGRFLSRFDYKSLFREYLNRANLYISDDGWYVTHDELESIIYWIEDEQFRKNSQKLIAILTESGLWKSVIDEINEALKFSYNDIIYSDNCSIATTLVYHIAKWDIREMNFRPCDLSKKEAEKVHKQTIAQIQEIITGSEIEFKTPVIVGKDRDITFTYSVAEIGKPWWKDDPKSRLGDGTKRAWYYEEYQESEDAGIFCLAINSTHAIVFDED